MTVLNIFIFEQLRHSDSVSKQGFEPSLSSHEATLKSALLAITLVVFFSCVESLSRLNSRHDRVFEGTDSLSAVSKASGFARTFAYLGAAAAGYPWARSKTATAGQQSLPV